VVDMGEVECIDTAWLGVLTQLRSRVYDQGEAHVRISAVSDAARLALEVSGLAALVETHGGCRPVLPVAGRPAPLTHQPLLQGGRAVGTADTVAAA